MSPLHWGSAPVTMSHQERKVAHSQGFSLQKQGYSSDLGRGISGVRACVLRMGRWGCWLISVGANEGGSGGWAGCPEDAWTITKCSRKSCTYC